MTATANNPAELTAELAVARATHAGATRLAARAWDKIAALRDIRLWLPCDAALKHLAEAIYFNAGYDAHERYASAEEFAEEFKADLDAAWPERVTREGIEHYELRPFFAESAEYMHLLNFGTLRVCALSELKALDVAPRARPDGAPVAGLEPEELKALIALHRVGALGIVNALRYMDTGLNYPRATLERMATRTPDFPVELEDGAPALLDALGDLATLAGVDAPMRYYSSNWDKECKVHRLDLDSTLAAFLRDA